MAKWIVQMNFEVTAADEDDATRVIEDACAKAGLAKETAVLKEPQHQDTWEEDE